VPLLNNAMLTLQAYIYKFLLISLKYCFRLFAFTLRKCVYIFESMFLSSTDFLPFPHWLIPKSCDEPYKKVARATYGPRNAGCRPLIYRYGSFYIDCNRGRVRGVYIDSVFLHRHQGVCIGWLIVWYTGSKKVSTRERHKGVYDTPLE
jgi:hypothetical protein